eukprot:Hpha_TRINITY_DN12603_c0_g1::TRINITY_DN12603_c0_g1_i1::g.49670::m.49670
MSVGIPRLNLPETAKFDGAGGVAGRALSAHSGQPSSAGSATSPSALRSSGGLQSRRKTSAGPSPDALMYSGSKVTHVRDHSRVSTEFTVDSFCGADSARKHELEDELVYVREAWTRKLKELELRVEETQKAIAAQVESLQDENKRLREELEEVKREEVKRVSALPTSSGTPVSEGGSFSAVPSPMVGSSIAGAPVTPTLRAGQTRHRTAVLKTTPAPVKRRRSRPPGSRRTESSPSQPCGPLYPEVPDVSEARKAAPKPQTRTPRTGVSTPTATKKRLSRKGE